MHVCCFTCFIVLLLRIQFKNYSLLDHTWQSLSVKNDISNVIDNTEKRQMYRVKIQYKYMTICTVSVSVLSVLSTSAKNTNFAVCDYKLQNRRIDL